MDIQSITRQVDSFLYREANRESQSYYRWEAENLVLSEVEAILTESEDYGINQSLSEFGMHGRTWPTNPAGTPSETP